MLRASEIVQIVQELHLQLYNLRLSGAFFWLTVANNDCKMGTWKIAGENRMG